MSYMAHIGEQKDPFTITFDNVKDLGYVFTADAAVQNLVSLIVFVRGKLN